MKKVKLEAARMTNKADMHAYMEEIFQFNEPAGNLDALYDNLSEAGEETELILVPEEIDQICHNAYSYKVLMLIGKAAEHNPNLHILFRKQAE